MSAAFCSHFSSRIGNSIIYELRSLTFSSGSFVFVLGMADVASGLRTIKCHYPLESNFFIASYKTVADVYNGRSPIRSVDRSRKLAEFDLSYHPTSLTIL